MLHIFRRRSPSQKLSKPVPKNGLPANPRATAQISVRPVKVGSLPTALRTLPPISRNTTEADTDNAATTKRCTTHGFVASARRLVAEIKPLASRKHNSEVIEFACQKSHITIKRRVP